MFKHKQPSVDARQAQPTVDARWLLFAWIALIFSLSNESHPSLFWDQLLGNTDVLTTFYHTNDKVIHASVWIVLTLCLWFASATFQYHSKWQRIGYVLVLAALMGGLDEFHQSFIPDRTCSLLDVGADIAGAVTALLFIGLYDFTIQKTFATRSITIQTSPE